MEQGGWSRDDGAGKVFLLKVGVGRVGESDKWEKSRGEFCYNLVGLVLGFGSEDLEMYLGFLHQSLSLFQHFIQYWVICPIVF